MNIKGQLQHKIDLKTKPKGALGLLEQLALQIGSLQGSLQPVLSKPHVIVFAGDHGVANDGLSAYPQEVTFQMVLNFLNGGAAINVFSRQHNITLKVVDAGVNFDFGDTAGLVHAKTALGTDSFLTGRAMTENAYKQNLASGAKLVQDIAAQGTNVIGCGEMGIGNTSAASMLMSYLCDLPVADCVGRGTGVDDAGLVHKTKALESAKAFHGEISDVALLLQTFGGHEMVQMCGAFLEAMRQGMLIMVDGFIATSAFLAAYKMEPGILKHAVFCHVSNESGHRRMLDEMNAKPLLNLGMRLGEGTGCAVAYPLLQSAVSFLNEMASFEDAGVSNKA